MPAYVVLLQDETVDAPAGSALPQSVRCGACLSDGTHVASAWHPAPGLAADEAGHLQALGAAAAQLQAMLAAR